MGESSAPRRPTHDTNTSRREVKIKYKYTMKFTRLIASTLMLLVVLMASTASARSIASAEPGSSIHLIHYPSIPDHFRDVLRSSQRHAAELTLWSAKLVTPVSPRRNSAEGTLTHMSALRSLITSHLIL